jgi:hypothetical protein
MPSVKKRLLPSLLLISVFAMSLSLTASAASYAEKPLKTLRADTVKLDTPQGTYSKGTISNLNADSSYKITASGIELTYDANENGKLELEQYSSDLVGKTITALVELGDGSSTTDSDSQVVSWAMPSEILGVPEALFSSVDSSLSNLTQGLSYTAYFTDSTSCLFTVSDVLGTFLLSSISTNIGKNLSGLKANGDLVTSFSSTIQSFASTPLVLLQNSTPNSTYDDGIISGLDGNGNYLINNLHTYQATPDGFIYVSSHWSELGGGKITSLVKVGDGITTSNSLSQDVSYEILSVKEDTPEASFSVDEGILTGLVASSSYILQLESGTSFYFSTGSGVTSYNLSAVSTLIGDKIAGLRKKGDGLTKVVSSLDSYNLTGKIILAHYPTPNPKYSAGVISNLVGYQAYILQTDKGNLTIVADGSGKIQARDHQTDLLGAHVTGFARKGDSTNYIDSAFVTVDFSFPSIVKATPEAEYDSSSGILSNLIQGESYRLNFTDNTYYSFYGDSSKQLNLPSISLILGKTLSSLQCLGDGTTSLDSLLELLPSYRIIASLNVPKSTYGDGIISGLNSGTDYYLVLQGGTKSSASSDAKGEIFLADYPSLLGQTITGIITKGDGTKYSDSATQATVYSVFASAEETPSATYDKSSGHLSGLAVSASYRLYFTDGTYIEFNSDINGNYVLALNSAAVKKTLAYLVKKGDGSSTICSAKETLTAAVILPKKATPAPYVKDGAICGLEVNSNFVFTDTDNKTYALSSDSKGLVNISDHLELLGKTMSSCVCKGENNVTLDSDSEANLSLKMPASQESPVVASTITINSQTGILSGLEEKSSYQIFFSDNTSITVNLATGVTSYDLSEFGGRKVIGIIKKGDGVNTIDSTKTTLDLTIPKKASEGWKAGLMTALGIIVGFIAIYFIFYVLWHKAGIEALPFFTWSYRKINKLLFKTEKNKKEIEEKNDASNKPQR